AAQFQVERLPQPPQGAGAVLVLTAALLGDDEQAAGRVPQPHRRTGLVALLTAGAAGAVRVHLALRQQLGVGEGRPVLAQGSRRSALGISSRGPRLGRKVRVGQGPGELMPNAQCLMPTRKESTAPAAAGSARWPPARCR